MTPAETAAILRQFNEWRRGEDETQPMPDPREIGLAIDAAIEMIERLEAAEKERDNANAAAAGVALRAAVRHEADCVEACKSEIDALRAKVDAMERQEPVAWARKLATGLPSFGCVTDLKYRPSNMPESAYMPLYALPGAQPAWGSQAVLDVTAERRRQIEVEGWTPEHDNEHSSHALAEAAACYCLSSAGKPFDYFETMWPWERWWFKASGTRRDLVKAGALILAEVERLDRAAEVGRKMK